MSNPFHSLNMEPSFAMDLAVLEDHYFQLQAQVHPDRFILRGQEAQLQASQKAANLNQAYQTLKDPLQRAKALLEMNGVEGGQTSSQNPQLLGEMMELQEEKLENPAGFQEKITQAYEAALEAMAQLFGAKDYAQAQVELERLAYLRRLTEERP